MTITARAIAITKPVVDDIPTPEALVAFCARASSPHQHRHDTSPRLLAYCIRNRHWSIFQMVNAVLEIRGPRDMTRQFLRHESIRIEEGEAGDIQAVPIGFDQRHGGIQEFSQRYAEVDQFCERASRRQDDENRQASHDDMAPADLDASAKGKARVLSVVKHEYAAALARGEAKETARVILPEGLAMSRLYANGTLRSWMHFINVRKGNGTQAEHVHLALACADALRPYFSQILAVAEEAE
jgi:thymidylate synthase (FAD)